MADVAKAKSEENQDKENIDESGDSEVEDSGKDKKNNVEKSKKRNAAPAAAAKIKPPAKKRVKAEQAEENKKEKEKDGKKKKPSAKEKEEEDEEGDEDEDAEEGDDEGSEGEENGVPEKVPLLDQPLEISGSRERKQVERFIPKEALKNEADKKVEIPNGKGKPLGEIPRIQFQVNKLKADNLKGLHRVLFNRVGQSQAIKENICHFKGFEFDKDSADFKKKLTVLTKQKNSDLKTYCTILDLTKSGKHAELAERILDFLLKPVDSGKEAPDPRPKRKGISSKSYKEPKADGDEESKKGKSKQHSPSKKKNKESSEEDEQDEDSDEKKSEDEENETAGSEEDKPKKGTTKQPPAKKTVSNAASGTKKRTANGGARKGKEKSESETEHNSEGEEDTEKVLPSKKPKSPPTDDEIKLYVKSVLEGANLEEITMKTVCKKVYEHYPDFDLGYKKEFIKNTVKSLIAS